MEILLLLERRAPVPHACEASIDAVPRIIEIVQDATVERVPEKVAEDLEVQRVERAVLHVDICTQRGRAIQHLQLGERDINGEKDVVDL